MSWTPRQGRRVQRALYQISYVQICALLYKVMWATRGEEDADNADEEVAPHGRVSETMGR